MDKKSWPLLWLGLFAVYAFFAVGFSIIQPLGRTPDEAAHVQYAKFLSDNSRLPLWQAEGGGEAGYEAQHPPLYYSLMAVVYRATAFMEARWRWQTLRWATILFIGVPLFFVCHRFFMELFASQSSAFAATATVVLMPLTLLYTGYVNPDGMTALWVTIALYLSWKAATQASDSKPDLKVSVLLGAVCGLALLTKLSGFPALMIALWAQLRAAPQSGEATFASPSRLLRCVVTLTSCLLVCGWWYIRSAMLYGSPFIHTEGKLGTGLKLAERTNLFHAAWFTWRETFLSTWAQRGWFLAGAWEYFLYAALCALLLTSAYELWRFRSPSGNESRDRIVADEARLRVALLLSAVLIVLIFLGQQWAFWTQDVEFNAGGRYMLSALAGIAILAIAGWSSYAPKVKRVLLGTWLGVLILMNLVSAWNIDTVLNPTYAPNWQYFHFPPGEER
jgi:4-amino-4-deoxy-L-arabinose transferase-like glycosyltransferase